MPSQNPGTVAATYLQSAFNQNHLPPREQLPKSVSESQRGPTYNENLSTQGLSYEHSVYDLPSTTPPARRQMLGQDFCPLAEATQSHDLGRQSSQQNHYHQTPQYLAQHGFSEITPSSQQPATSGFPTIDDTQHIHADLFHLGIGHTFTSSLSLPEANLDFMGAQDQRTRLARLQLYPNTGQNLSAGSIGAGFSEPPSHDAVNTTSASSDPF